MRTKRDNENDDPVPDEPQILVIDNAPGSTNRPCSRCTRRPARWSVRDAAGDEVALCVYCAALANVGKSPGDP